MIATDRHGSERTRRSVSLPETIVAPALDSAVSASRHFSCGLRIDGTVKCWGDNSLGQTDAPSGSFSAVSAGGGHSCGLRDDSTLVCWGFNHRRQTDAPSGSFRAVSAGWNHSCGLRTNGTVTCWGDNGAGQSDAPSGIFENVSAGDSYTCGLRPTGIITCWGGLLTRVAETSTEHQGGRVVHLWQGELGPTSVGSDEGIPCTSETPTCRYLDITLRGFAPGSYTVSCSHDGWGDFGPSTFWTFTITVDESGYAFSRGPCFLNLARLTGNGAYVTVSRPGTGTITSNWLKQ